MSDCNTFSYQPSEVLSVNARRRSGVKDTAVEGPAGAGTFFGKKAQSVSRGFVDLAHQPVSKRGDIMMHHKSLLALLPDIERGDGGSDHIDDEEVVGWIYMGSHNLTQAAWGNISSASASTLPQLTCQNWELGLVLPFRRRDLKADSTSDAAKIVTWKRPVEKYQDGDVPWVSRRGQSACQSRS